MKLEGLRTDKLIGFGGKLALGSGDQRLISVFEFKDSIIQGVTGSIRDGDSPYKQHDGAAEESHLK